MNERPDVAPWKRWSSAFKLTLHGPTFYDFTRHHIVVVRARPARVWQKPQDVATSRWYSLRDPDFDVASLIREVRFDEILTLDGVPPDLSPLPQSAYQVRRRKNFRAFLEHVPVDVQDLVADGWSGATWSYFRLLSVSPLARELAHTPGGDVFVWTLSRAHDAVPFDERKGIARRVERLLRMKRKHALGELGFPALPSTLSVLAKVPREELQGGTIDALKAALAWPEGAKRCHHAQRLPRALLEVLTPEVLTRVTPSLLQELEGASDHGRPGSDRLILDTLTLAREQDVKIGVLTSIAQATELHDELVRLARENGPTKKDVPLPPLPVGETNLMFAFLKYLSTTQALLREGREMHHCLGTLTQHHQLALAGRFFAFAVEVPERATVAIWRPFGATRWSVYDAKGPCNAPIGDGVRSIVRAALREFENVVLSDELDASP